MMAYTIYLKVGLKSEKNPLNHTTINLHKSFFCFCFLKYWNLLYKPNLFSQKYIQKANKKNCSRQHCVNDNIYK